MMKIGEVFLFGHVKQIVDHEIRRIKGVATGSVALGRASKIKPTFLEEIVLQVKTRGINLVSFVAQQRGENEGRHAGVKVLADFQCDLHFFRERW